MPKPLPRWLLLAITALPLLTAAIAAVRASGTLETRAHADSVYVRKDSFALTHQRDSITYLYEIRGIHSAIDQIATDLKKVRR